MRETLLREIRAWEAQQRRQRPRRTQVSGEDFAGIVGKLSTPRELLIMMTSVFNRLERNPPGSMLTAKDMEAAVEEAQTQSV